MRRSLPLILAAIAVAGCGSAETLPAPEAPSMTMGGARLDTRARTLTVADETVDAGAGPSGLLALDGRVYVLDAVQPALLVYEKEPDLHLQRRAWLPERPDRFLLFGALDRQVLVELVSGDVLEFTPGGVER